VGGRYHASFFSTVAPGSRASAERVGALLLTLPGIESVVDVGCGTGGWLAELAELGIVDYLGIDGSYIDQQTLAIPSDRFQSRNLEEPIVLDRRFDLALSLEVAEHLRPEYASTHVDSLTRLAPIVVFSAAIPGQGGVGHVNEQWPDYWEALFASREFVLIDWFRRQLWEEAAIEPWYRQNLFLYADRERAGQLAQVVGDGGGLPLRVVHPEIFRSVVARPLSLRAIARATPQALKTSLAARWTRRPRWLATSSAAAPGGNRSAERVGPETPGELGEG
jgi:SAM-dependent methyltransferase